jgi:hypothetical protein
MSVAVSPYEIRVIGNLGMAARQAFADVTVDAWPATTVLSGRLSQADLHELLDRIRGLGLELVEVRQTVVPPS